MALSVVNLATAEGLRLYSDEQVEAAGGGAYYLVKRGEQPMLDVESSGVATVETRINYYKSLCLGSGRINVTATRSSSHVKGLPSVRRNTIYIVSEAVAMAVPDRGDVFFLREALMDVPGGFVGLRHA